METQSKEARKMVLQWYQQGVDTLESGAPYDPPLIGVPMCAYCLGYEDAINGIRPSDERIYELVMKS